MKRALTVLAVAVTALVATTVVAPASASASAWCPGVENTKTISNSWDSLTVRVCIWYSPGSSYRYRVKGEAVGFSYSGTNSARSCDLRLTVWRDGTRIFNTDWPKSGYVTSNPKRCEATWTLPDLFANAKGHRLTVYGNSSATFWLMPYYTMNSWEYGGTATAYWQN